MVGHRPLEASILVRVQVWQQIWYNTIVNNCNKITLKSISFAILFAVSFSIWICLYLYISTACSMHIHQVDIFNEHLSHAQSLILATVTNFFVLVSFIFISLFFLKFFNIDILEKISEKYLVDKSPPLKKKLIRAISNPRSPPFN